MTIFTNKLQVASKKLSYSKFFHKSLTMSIYRSITKKLIIYSGKSVVECYWIRPTKKYVKFIVDI